jgi:geranylgeranyl diphosphate synthase type I
MRMFGQAAGGSFERADFYAAAWLLYYTAANTLDHIEDGDAPDAWWAGTGASRAINATTALLASAAEALNRASQSGGITQQTAFDITTTFHNTILRMASGQHRDLSPERDGLESYWEIAAAKSGAFFSLACYCGARLATDTLPTLEHYRSYGHHLGVLIQILDDLEPYQTTLAENDPKGARKVSGSLPAIYALTVLPETERQELSRSLGMVWDWSGDLPKAIELIEKSGAALYVKIELEKHRAEGLEAIQQAKAEGAAGDFLKALIANLGKTKAG